MGLEGREGTVSTCVSLQKGRQGSGAKGRGKEGKGRTRRGNGGGGDKSQQNRATC